MQVRESVESVAGDHPPAAEPVDLQLADTLARERMCSRLRMLWTERRFLLRLGCVALAISTLIAFLIPKLYSTQVQIMPPDTQSANPMALISELTGKTGGLGAFAGDLLAVKTTGALFMGVLQSRTVRDRIVQRFDLKKVYGVGLELAARQKLAENTSISEDRKSGIISLSVADHDAKRAAAIASAYVEELDALMAQVSTSSARRERVFLEQRLSSVKQELNSAEKDFSQFATKNGTIDITEQGKAMVVAAATLEGQLIAAQSELEGLKQIYTDNNVRVRATQARITELRHQLEKFGGKAEPAYDPNNAPSPDVYPSLRQLPVLGVPYADLFRRLKIEEAVYETLTKQYELAKVQEAKEIPTVKVLDSAEVPERKSYPPRLLIVFLGTVFGFVLGISWVEGRSRWEEVKPQDPAKVLVNEVAHGLKMRLPFASANGNRTNESAGDKLDGNNASDGPNGA
jgi:uncharacterized protein involved in exopolysaccharide biosynthesis